MAELLAFYLVVVIIGFIMPFLVMLLAMSHIKIDKVGILAIFMGFLIAFFISSILYLSVATISHNTVGFYSHYGSKFSKFYTDFLSKTTIFVNILLILLWFGRSFIGNKNFALSLLASYQLSLILLNLLDTILVFLLEKIGLIDLSIAYFAKNMGILPSDVDIRSDLVRPKLGTQSLIQISIFFFFNNILAILMILQLWRINKHNRKINKDTDNKSDINRN